MPKAKVILSRAEVEELSQRFRTALDRAGVKQSEFARMLAAYRPDISVETHARRVRTWATGEAPVIPEALMALDLLAKSR